MLKSIIFHIDVNSAFLSWEAVYRIAHRGGKLDLREVPSAVGGDMSIQNQLKEDLEYDQMILKEYIDPFAGESVKQKK